MAFLSFILMNITSVGFIICHDHLAKTLIKAKSNRQFINEKISKRLNSAFCSGAVICSVAILIVSDDYVPLVLFCFALYVTILWQKMWKLYQKNLKGVIDNE